MLLFFFTVRTRILSSTLPLCINGAPECIIAVVVCCSDFGDYRRGGWALNCMWISTMEALAWRFSRHQLAYACVYILLSVICIYIQMHIHMHTQRMHTHIYMHTRNAACAHTQAAERWTTKLQSITAAPASSSGR